MTAAHRKALKAMAERSTGDPDLDKMVRAIVERKLAEEKKA